MKDFETGAVRDTGGKGRMDLLPMCALLRVSKHMEDSLTHYPERNWELGMPMHCMLDSAMRHLAKYMDGMTDEDHLGAAATNLLMALWTEEKKPEMQDIPSRKSGEWVVPMDEPQPRMILVSGGGTPHKMEGGGGNPPPMGCGGNGSPLSRRLGGPEVLVSGVPACAYFTYDGRCAHPEDGGLCMVQGKPHECYKIHP